MTKAPAQWTWRSHGLDQSKICLMFSLRFLSAAPPTYGWRWTLESCLLTPAAWIQPRLIGQPSRGQLSWSFRHLLVLTWQRLDHEDMHVHCPAMPGSAIRLLEVWRLHVPCCRALFTPTSYSAVFELVAVMVSAVPGLSHAPSMARRSARQNAGTIQLAVAVRLDRGTRSGRRQGMIGCRVARFWGRAT